MTAVPTELNADFNRLAAPLIGHLPANLRCVVVIIVNIAFQRPRLSSIVARKAGSTIGGVRYTEFTASLRHESGWLVLVARTVVGIIQQFCLALITWSDIDITPRDSIVRRGVPDKHRDGELNLGIAADHPREVRRISEIVGTAVSLRIQAHCQ